ncbi:MAG TPA: HAD family phosphatase [Candidatus Binatia bacterium]|nr:HAD family phosphatase [Candidatus Binatia bacterium]
MTNEPFAHGVIFDMDGVLIDSEGLYYRAYSEVLKPYGVTVSRPEYEEYWIAQGNGPEYIVAKHNLPVSPDELRQLRSPVYLRFLETAVTLMPYVEEALARLSPHFSLSVATNSNREHLDFVLRRFGIDRFFPVTIARQDYRGAKPLPDAFLAAAEKLGLPPARCLVIEDTYRGVMAAANAGMACIAVPNEYTLRNDFSRASLVLANLGELTPEVVLNQLRVKS